MKVDVVIAYFRQEHLWPFVAWGLQRNAAHINRVLLINDEPWTWTPTLPGIPLVLLDHPHDGFGMTRSYNQGALASETDTVLFIQGDLVLESDFLAKALPRTLHFPLLYTWVFYIEIPATPSDLEQPSRIALDWRGNDGLILELRQKHRMFILGKGASFLVNRAQYLALGGFDEHYAPLGPNCEDHDFAARWIMAYGPDTLDFGHSVSWHLGDPPAARVRNFLARMPSYASRARLAGTLGRYFNNRYTLFGTTNEIQKPRDLTRCLVGHASDKQCDVRVDCLQLAWMQDGTAQAIDEGLPTTYLPVNQIEEHLATVFHKLAPSGELTLYFPERPPWTTARLSAYLKSVGFEIEEEELGELTVRRPERDALES